MNDINGRRELFEGHKEPQRRPVRPANYFSFQNNSNTAVSGPVSTTKPSASKTTSKPVKKGFLGSKYLSYLFFKTPLLMRVGAGVLALLILGTILMPIKQSKDQVDKYNISKVENSILRKPVDLYADKLVHKPQNQKYIFNEGYTKSSEVGGDSNGPKISAEFSTAEDKTVTVTDPINSVSISFKPKFAVGSPQKNKNRMVYPVANQKVSNVYTLKASGVKEDIIVHSFQGDELSFKYDLSVSDGTEVRLENDGSLGVYGVNTQLLGDIATGNDADAKLLDNARKNGKKDQLLFRIPAPFVVEAGGKATKAEVKYSLEGKEMTIHASKLKDASYPLSIDPSIYVETARKLMRGNNESNIDFDVDNELIQKSQTTGARIDAWTDTTNMSDNLWDHSTAVAGGYVYTAGGTNVVSTTTVYSSTGSATFNVPSGITSITVKAWGGAGGGGGGGSAGIGGIGGGGGFAQATLTVTPLEALTVYVGAGGGLGTGRSDSGDGGGGGGHSEVNRSGTNLLVAPGGGGGGGGDNSSATAGGAGGAGGNTTGIAGSASSSAAGGGAATGAAGGSAGTGGGNSGSAGGSETAGDGADGRSAAGADGGANNGGAADDGDGGTGSVVDGYAAGGGGGGGLYGGGGGSGSAAGNAGGGGGGSGSCMTSGTGIVCTAGSGTTPGNSSDSDRSGAADGGTAGALTSNGTAGDAGRIVIIYTTSTTVSTELNWAQFNTATGAIDSPNPGTGTCSGWCTNSAYNLPAARIGMSLVAYNGFLYAMGGTDGTTRASTVYIAKLGANGEPQLWHPSGGAPVYWYTDTGLNGATARSYHSAYAYNNRMYVLGGQTNASAGGVTTVEEADINPTGTLSSWTTTGMQALPDVRHSFSVHVYNDVMYLIGGNSNGTLRNTVYYSKLASTGTMSSWTATTSFTSARSSFGGTMTGVLGGYIYIAGGCTALTGVYCSTIATDVQLVSINADGTLAGWNTIIGLENARIGYSFIAWQGGLYRFGGCSSQNTSTGACQGTLAEVEYGVVNPDGEASTVATSVASGVAPCSGASPHSCNLPGTASIGNMLSSTAIVNGYLYIIGGCTNNACTTVIGNTAYSAIGSDGTLQKPASCPGGTAVDSYCVDSTNPITSGIGAAGIAIFGGRIYVVGGFDASSDKGNVYNVVVNNDGSLNGTWTAQTFANLGMTTNLSYTYAYSRANPSSAGSTPANLFVFGGCVTGGGPGCSSYSQSVYKCNILTTGSLDEVNATDCDTTNQLQIGTVSGASGTGLGAHAGTVYANYIYLIGGLAPSLTDLTTVRYAKFDNNNNVVTVSSGWVQETEVMNTGRRRGAGFGYNGYIYVVGGYDAVTGVLADIEFAQIDVSDGSLGAFRVSSVSINQRWGLSVPVSNSYAYVIGGCTVGASPSSCSTRTDSIQTFQIYNNDSGAVAAYSAASDDTFVTSTDRWGSSSAVLNGYLYVAGGCTSATDCTAATANVQKSPISAADGTLGTWTETSISALPAVRAWGQLVVAGGYLYYLGGQDSTTTNEQSSIYYAQPDGSGNIASWSTASGGIGDLAGAPAAQERTKFGAAVWNGRIYVAGGLNVSAAATSTVYVSPDLSSGGNIAADSWTSSSAFNVARYGGAVAAYANNLYLLGGNDGTNYLSDTQYTQINSDGTVDAWSYSTSLPGSVSQGGSYVANGYIYLIGGRSAVSTCVPNTLVAPISANTTIASGNNPTGVGEWFETNQRYTGDRYGNAVSYANGKAYVMGGGCTAPLASTRHYYATVKSQPQIAKYSRMIDTDTDVFPTKWLMNGLDNSTGALWQLRYRSMHDTSPATDTVNAVLQQNPNEDCGTSATMPVMTTWGTETNYGNVTLGTPDTYTPLNGSLGNINCARFFYFSANIDSSQAFGYPDDVSRGPTISDLSLFFTSDPSKRLRHGKTFTGGEQQPLDTPF